MTRRRVAATVVVALACLMGLSVRAWVVSDAVHVGDVAEADAVVMFVGGRGERLETALELMQAGVAPVLVIPNGTVAEWPAGNTACADDLGFEVLCPDPDPDNTRGEARLIAALAAERGWERIVYVTSDYHRSRAGRLLAFCFDGTTEAVPAASGLSATSWLARGTREWVANLAVRTIDRGC